MVRPPCGTGLQWVLPKHRSHAAQVWASPDSQCGRHHLGRNRETAEVGTRKPQPVAKHLPTQRTNPG